MRDDHSLETGWFTNALKKCWVERYYLSCRIVPDIPVLNNGAVASGRDGMESRISITICCNSHQVYEEFSLSNHITSAIPSHCVGRVAICRACVEAIRLIGTNLSSRQRGYTPSL